MPDFYDTHAHLDFPDFTPDLAQVIERAALAGISKIISIGTDLESSMRAVKLAERFSGVFAAVGWHPCQASEAPEDVRPALRELAGHPKVVAIGETGLDYHRSPAKPQESTEDESRCRSKQASLFLQHLEVAEEFGLNCVIHQRKALEDVLTQMRPFAGRVSGVFHCFVDNPVDMRSVLAMGSLVSFTGIVTFKNAQSVRETVVATPPDRFLLETDCPYLAPAPHRGQRCEPAHVKEIAETVARARNGTLEELSRATCASASRFFPKLG